MAVRPLRYKYYTFLPSPPAVFFGLRLRPLWGRGGGSVLPPILTKEEDQRQMEQYLGMIVCGLVSFIIGAVIAFFAGVQYRMKVAEAELDRKSVV